MAPGAVSLTGDWAQGDDSKHDSHFFFIIQAILLLMLCNDPVYTICIELSSICSFVLL